MEKKTWQRRGVFALVSKRPVRDEDGIFPEDEEDDLEADTPPPVE